MEDEGKAKGATYTCYACGEKFESGWTEEEARAEATANGWGSLLDNHLVIVCNPCYVALVAWAWASGLV